LESMVSARGITSALPSTPFRSSRATTRAACRLSGYHRCRNSRSTSAWEAPTARRDRSICSGKSPGGVSQTQLDSRGEMDSKAPPGITAVSAFTPSLPPEGGPAHLTHLRRQHADLPDADIQHPGADGLEPSIVRLKRGVGQKSRPSGPAHPPCNGVPAAAQPAPARRPSGSAVARSLPPPPEFPAP
jgi:hypothetical protein